MGEDAEGTRLTWTDIPAKVRSEVEKLIGGRVAHTSSRSSGFSPGLAARVDLVDGRSFFVKAASPAPNPDTPDIHRSEARIAASLPPSAPVPGFVGVYDDGAWVALAFEYIDGRPPALPWKREELHRVLSSLEHLSRAMTPSPVDAPPIAQKHEPYLQGWSRLLQEKVMSGHDLSDVDPWIRRNLSRLAEREASWPEAAKGDTLLHADIRADNILLTPTEVYFVDWPWACIGAPWIDLMAMLPSVHMQGGPPPWELFDTHPLAQKAASDAVTTYLTAFAGYLTWSSQQPPPPGIPTLRGFQRDQGTRALEWLKRRTGWA